MLTIAIASSFKANYGGNFISQIINLGRTLEQQGLNVIYIFPIQAQNKDWCWKMQADGNKLYFINRQNVLQDLISLWRLINLLKINIIHTHFGMLDLPSAIVSVLNPQLKHIIHARAESPSPKNLYRSFLRSIKYKHFYSKSYVIAISNTIFNEYLDYGLSKERINLIEDGISFKRLIVNKTNEEVREELGIHDEDVYLMMGYNFHIKGVDIVIKSFNHLQADSDYTRHFILAIIVASNLEKLKGEIVNLFGHIPSYVKFLPPTEYIANYYNCANCFISASRTEGFSNAIAEAIQMKLPVISSDIEGTKWAARYSSVMSFKNENYHELKVKIAEIFTNVANEDTQLSSNAIELEYGIDKWLNKVLAFYREHNISGK